MPTPPTASTPAATKALRDQRLDDLKKATDTWAKAETDRLTYEKDFLKAVMQGRTGAGRLASKNVASASVLVVDAIKIFLEG